MTEHNSAENCWSELAGDRAAVHIESVPTAKPSELPSELPSGLMDEDLARRLAHLRAVFAQVPQVLPRLEIPRLRAAAQARQWAGSRRCLVAVLEELLGSGRSPPQIRVSLSHCVDLSIAVASADPAIAGVGVDIERLDRKLSQAATSRVLFPREAEAGITGLEAWVLKEASYKSDPENDGRVIANYRLNPRGARNEDGYYKDGYEGTREGSGCSFRLRLIRKESHLIGLAVCSPNS